MARRVLVPALAFAFSALIVSAGAEQAKPATAGAGQAKPESQPTPPGKWIPPVKGIATVEVILGKPKRVGKDVVTVLKVKNTSKGPIALLGVEEFWYNQKGDIISGDTFKLKRLLQPGEIVDVTLESPAKEGLYSNRYVFTHANGKIDGKTVKSFQ